MGSLSNYAEAKLQDHVFKTASYTPATHLYVAFCTADPTDSGTGSSIAEPSGNSYARVQCDVWNAAASRASANTNVITFPQASGAGWGTVTHFAILDNSTGGNMLAYGALSASKVIVSGNVPTISAGDCHISVVTGALSTYLSNKLLDHLLKTSAYTPPTHIDVALSRANPTDDASGIDEPTIGSLNYSRTQCDSWNTANTTTGAVSNVSAITTPTASGSWGTIAYVALYDASTSGNMLWYGTVSPSQAVGANDYMEWTAASFVVTLD